MAAVLPLLQVRLQKIASVPNNAYNSSIKLMFAFSRNLNLLLRSDAATFVQELEGSGRFLPFADQDDLSELIAFSRRFFPDSAFTIQWGSTLMYLHPKHAQHYNFLDQILPAMRFLRNHSHNQAFMKKVETKLTNMRQFHDTLFELECLSRFSENGFSFEYEPEVDARTGVKNPDFRLMKDDIELFCECKQSRTGQDRGSLHFSEQVKDVQSKLPDDLLELLHSAGLRLEINFKTVPSQSDLDHLATLVSKLSDEAEGIRETPVQQVGNNIEYVIVPQNKPDYFPMKSTKVGRMTVGTRARGLFDPESGAFGGEIVVSSADLSRRQRSTLAKSLREARRQLPDACPGILLLNRAKLHTATEAIESRMNTPHYANVIAVVVNPFEDLWSCYRTAYRGLLADLFDGFRPENAFLAR